MATTVAKAKPCVLYISLKRFRHLSLNRSCKTVVVEGIVLQSASYKLACFPVV